MLQESLEQELYDNDIELMYYPFSRAIEAVYCDNTVAINKSIEGSQKINALTAHELGHFHECAYNLLEASPEICAKQETLAQRWATLRVMPIEKILDAYTYGAQNIYEFCDYLEIDQAFFIEGLLLYAQMYGQQLRYGAYIVSFDPFNITNE